jgi:NADPH2:quinone reductase
MRAIQIEEFGGPEVLTVREVDEPVAGAGEQVFDVLAAGINYADTHQSEDSYLAKQKLPLIPGSEVVVEAADGRRLVTMLANSGGYAERAALNPEYTFEVPPGVSNEAALTTLVQGATAWHLLRTSTHLAPGESVVVHAGAGGVGTMAIQLAQRWGAGRVIATASSPEKRALALELGADVAIDSNVEDMREALREANDGRGVDIVLEMTGGRVCDQSLAALAPFGRLAFFGQASRQAPSKVDPTVLMAHSTAVIGFWLAHVARRPDMMGAAVNELLALIDGDVIRPIIGGSYALADAADAHRALLERSSIGKLILLPQS